MQAGNGNNKKLVIIMVCMATMRYDAEAIVTCNELQNGLIPCLGFLKGRALVPQCCNGVRSMAAAAGPARGVQMLAVGY